MKNLKTSRSGLRYCEEGFGFSELLVVVAIIGVLTAIAIPALANIFGRADTAKAGRNAQSLVATFNASRAAGNSSAYTNATEAIAAVTNATNGGIKGAGVFKDSKFFVSMSQPEIEAATLKIQSTLVGSDTEGTLTISQTP